MRCRFEETPDVVEGEGALFLEVLEVVEVLEDFD